MFPVLALLLLASTLHHPGSNKLQSISDLLLFKHSPQHVSPFQAMDALTVVIPNAIQLVLPLPDLFLKTLDGIHCTPESCHLSYG